MPAIIAKIYSRWQAKTVNGAKITRGHINRTINYVLEHTPEKDRPRVLGGQGFEYAITDEETARRAGREMEGLSDQGPPYPPGPRPNPLLHISLSWPHSENPTDEHMVESGRSALKALGVERAWGIFVRHHDTKHHHMHFVGSRIDPETRSTFAALRGYNRDRPKMLEWARDYERQRELERIPERTLDRPLDQDRQRQGFENLSAAMERLASGAKDNVRGNNRFEEVPVPEGGDGFRLGVTLDKQGVRRLDIEMVDFEQRGTGAFTRYLDHMESESIKHRFSGIGVNDIMNSRLEKFLQRRGYGELSNDSPNPLKSLFKPREAFERGMEPALERGNDWAAAGVGPDLQMEAMGRAIEAQNARIAADTEWRRIAEGSASARDLQHPDNFDEFAAARGLGRLDPREAEKLKNDHANERMLSDFDYFSKLDRDKPERTATLEHQNENTEGMPFYSPMGAKVVNRWADLDEIQHQKQQINEMEPVEKIALKKDSRERGGGRERSMWDDGSADGQSGYGGE